MARGQQQQVKVKPSDLTPFRRQYATLNYRTSGSDTFTLLRDSMAKKFRLTFAGSVAPTWASGSPLFSQFGAWALISSIQVTIINSNGTRVVKDIVPAIAQRQQLFSTGVYPERRYSIGATATADPKTQGALIPGTTGQVISFREVLELSFQDIFNPLMASQSTILDLRDAISANVRVNWNAPNSLERADNAAVLTWPAPVATLELVPVGECFAGNASYDLVESWKQPQFTAQGKYLIELPVGNSLRSIMLLAQNGNASRAFHNYVIQAMRIKVQGQTKWESTFQATQSGNRNEFAGLNAPYASSVSDVDGCTLIDLTNAGVLETSLDLHGVKQAYLEIETTASGTEGVSYSSFPAQVITHFQEVVFK